MRRLDEELKTQAVVKKLHKDSEDDADEMGTVFQTHPCLKRSDAEATESKMISEFTNPMPWTGTLADAAIAWKFEPLGGATDC